MPDRWRLRAWFDRFCARTQNPTFPATSGHGGISEATWGAWITRQIRGGDLLSQLAHAYEVHFQSPPGEELDTIFPSISRFEPFLTALEARYP